MIFYILFLIHMIIPLIRWEGRRLYMQHYREVIGLRESVVGM